MAERLTGAVRLRGAKLAGKSVLVVQVEVLRFALPGGAPLPPSLTRYFRDARPEDLLRTKVAE